MPRHLGLLLATGCAPGTLVLDDTATDTDPVPWGLDARPVNATCHAFDRPVTGGAVKVEAAGAARFVNPVGLLQAPGDADRWYVVEQRGTVSTFVGTPATGTLAVDLRDRVVAGGEKGLLGLAFPPDFVSRRRVFVSYTTTVDGQLVSRVAELPASADGATFDRAHERVVLSLAQPFENHNGGNLAFGPDGFLYVGFGDGGSGGDPLGSGQDTGSLLGKMLRLDVGDAGAPYAIPADNPFADGGGRPEIYAWGLRNPWRWSFDPATGELWVGDVGQGAWEEIDRVEKGGNYGWNRKEGTHCYGAGPCDDPAFVDPVAEYGHDEGVSVTGGVVYRGDAIPGLRGTYLYGDFGSGRVWALAEDAASGAWTPRVLLESGLQIASFGQGHDGEAWIVAYDGGLWRLVRDGDPPPDTFPRTLSATGCADPGDPTRPAPGLIPYAPAVSFWSDGAEKSRWLALPEGGVITAEPDGDLTLPVGSVLRKDFRVDGALVETRLLVRHDDGTWSGHTYAWRPDGTDADWVPAGGHVGDWALPSSGACLQCHTSAAGRTLGLELRQLDVDLDYGGATANQLATLRHLGVLADAVGADPGPLPDPFGAGTLEARARSYLHVNCAMCHRPGGNGLGPLDLRFDTPFAGTGLCEAPENGDLGIPGARIVVPGKPAQSVLVARMRGTGVERMPPVGSHVVDEDGLLLVRQWIGVGVSCPE